MNPVRVICALAFAAAAAQALPAQRTDLRLGGQVQLARRHHVALTDDARDPGTASAALVGIETLMRGLGGGLQASYARATFAAGSGAPGVLKLLEGRLLIGPRPFSVEAGYRRYSRGILFASKDGEDHWLAGVRSEIGLGPSGLAFGLGGGVALRWDTPPATGAEPVGSSGAFKVVGWDGRTAVHYQAPGGVPLHVTLGYRFLRVAPKRRLDAAGSLRPEEREELSSLVLGVGIRYSRE